MEKFNIKNKTAAQFRDHLQGRQNCFIIAKVQQDEGSKSEFYAGFAPDADIFLKSDKLIGKNTGQTEKYNFPYTLDLNTFVKRDLIDQYEFAYGCDNNSFFNFNFGFQVCNNNFDYQFSFAFNDEIYKSIFETENLDQKRYKVMKDTYSLEIEVIQLFL